MPGKTNLSPLIDLFDTVLLYLSRSAVQSQLVVVLIGLFVCGLAAKRLAISAAPTLEAIDRSGSSFSRWKRYGLPLVTSITFPILAIIFLWVSRQIWQLLGWYAGLITLSIEIMLLYLVYRLILGLFYALFPDDHIRRYHRRLFAPLFAVLVIGIILGQLAELGELGQLVVGSLYNNPVTVGALLLATIGLYFWIIGAWAVQDVTSHAIKTRTEADTSNVDAYLTLGRYMLILIGLLIVFSALNLNPSTVAAVLGGLAVGVSFGLREIVSNFVSGIWLLIERSVRPGDIIEVDGTAGTVVELNMRATIVRTFEGVLLIVPNQKLFTSTVKTFTLDDRSFRGLVLFRVSPKNPSEKVMQIILEAAQDHSDIISDPEPSVTFQDVGPTYAEYRLTFWLDDLSDRLRVSSELRSVVMARFIDEEIELLPQKAIVAGALEG